MMLGQNERFFGAARIYTLSGVLHFIPLLLGASDGGFMAIAGVIVLLLAMALSRGYLGALAFLIAAFGLSAALYGYMTSFGALQWVYLGILGADALTALLLFVALWRGREAG